jgi:hypothetical protein
MDNPKGGAFAPPFVMEKVGTNREYIPAHPAQLRAGPFPELAVAIGLSLLVVVLAAGVV